MQDELRKFKEIHEAQELWEEYGSWERWWCEKCGALYEWNPEMDEPCIEIPRKGKSCVKLAEIDNGRTK